MPIVDDHGPRADDDARDAGALRIGPDADPAALAAQFDTLGLIVIGFEKYADGRGFSLAQRLRGLGFAGRLRAQGWLLPDQYAYARACGFDDVAVDADHFARHGAQAWAAAAAAPVAPPFRSRRRAAPAA